MPILKQGKYQLAQTKWMDREASGFTKTFLKLPPGAQLYKLKVGKAKLDIVPYVAGKRNSEAQEGMLYWKITFWVHRNIGPNRDTVICPAKTIGKPCPVCEDFNRQMRMNPDDEEYQRIQELKPKEWELMQVRDRNDPEKKIQLLPLSFHRFSDKIAEQAAMGDAEQRWEDFWHPKGGKALLVNWKEDTSGKGKYIRAMAVNFLDRPDIPDSVIDKGHCLDDCLLIYKYDKLVELYGEARGEEPEEEPEEETPDVEEGEEAPEMEEEGEEAPAPPKKPAKPVGKKPTKPAPEPEEEEPEEETPEEEPQEEAPDEESPEEEPQEEESEEGETWGEEEPEEEPAPKPKTKPAAKPASKPAAKPKGKPAPEPEESTEEVNWGAFEEEAPDEESPEETEEEAPAPPKKPAKPVGKPAGKPVPKKK